MNLSPGIDPQLPPDFAVRVLETADRLIMRRRRLRQIVGASALCVAISAAAVWLGFSVAPQRPGQSPNLIAASAGTSAASQDGAPDALSWLFPDAEPLARYAEEDAPNDSGNSAGALFIEDD